ncbi:MAG: transporter substrate-binding domain-containing protein [Bacillota bacterium]
MTKKPYSLWLGLMAVCCCVAILAGCGTVPDVTSKPVTLLVGIEDSKPFTYTTDGVAKGVFVETVTEACKRVGVEVNFKLYPWADLMRMAQAGEIDGLLSPVYTDERATFMTYTKTALAEDNASFFVLPDSKISFSGDFTKLGNNKVATIKGYCFGNGACDSAIDDGIIHVEQSNSLRENIQKVVDKQADMLLEYDMAYEFEIQAMDKPVNTLKKLTPSASPAVKFFIAFSKKSAKADQELIDKIDEALLKIKSDGTYTKIYKSYVK